MNIKGLKKIATDSKSINGAYDPAYLQLNYNKATGEAWTDYHYSIGHNSWTEYNDPDIIRCGTIHGKMTMKEIAEKINYFINRG